MQEPENEGRKPVKEGKKNSKKKTGCLVLCGTLVAAVVVSLAVVVYFITDGHSPIPLPHSHRDHHGIGSNEKIPSDQVNEPTSDVDMRNTMEEGAPPASNDDTAYDTGYDTGSYEVDNYADYSSLEDLCVNQCKQCTPGEASPSTSLTADIICRNGCGHGHCIVIRTSLGPNGFHCHCFEGFTGTTCEDEIDECRSNPCGLNGQECVDQGNGYYCACKARYEGRHCEIEKDVCDPDPCPTMSFCIPDVNAVNGYGCS